MSRTVTHSIRPVMAPTAPMNMDMNNLRTDHHTGKNKGATVGAVTEHNTKDYIPLYQKKEVVKKKELIPFHTYKGNSYNTKASLSKQNA